MTFVSIARHNAVEMVPAIGQISRHTFCWNRAPNRRTPTATGKSVGGFAVSFAIFLVAIFLVALVFALGILSGRLSEVVWEIRVARRSRSVPGMVPAPSNNKQQTSLSAV